MDSDSMDADGTPGNFRHPPAVPAHDLAKIDHYFIDFALPID